jgi:hypothetical protein
MLEETLSTGVVCKQKLRGSHPLTSTWQPGSAYYFHGAAIGRARGAAPMRRTD